MDFQIDTDRMKTLIGRLDQVDDRMRDAQQRLNKVGPKGLGTDGLDEACDDFQDDWGDGIKRIADAAKTLHEGLQKTLDAYLTTDQDIQKGFSQ
ncbi:WXG100 family type VII secretion target [Streptomyces sp. NPDC102360]|uniref:WXG100 family type VII secretion target n=1 Tax=Streptomyces sp. NPDC102360 TaxID=3366160 RepID=UPI00380DCFC8